MFSPEFRAMVAREQYRDMLAAAEHARLVAMARASRPSVTSRLVQLAGRLLVRIGLALLEYDPTGSLATRRNQPHPACITTSLHHKPPRRRWVRRQWDR